MLCRYLLLLACLCIFLSAVASPVSESQAITTIQASGPATSQYLSVSAAFATTSEGKPGLKFVVKNISGATLHINTGLLPWAWPKGLNIMVAAWRWGDVLQSAPPPPPAHRIGNPGFIDLKPGDSLEGVAPIDEYVTDFDQARKKGEVIIQWWTEIWGDKERLGKFGGWVDFPKTTPGDVS